MSKLITIKNKVTGNITRQPIGSIELAQFRGRHLGRFCFVQKKAFKRQEKDKSKIRSRKQPRPFGAKLHERLAKKYGKKSQQKQQFGVIAEFNNIQKHSLYSELSHEYLGCFLVLKLIMLWMSLKYLKLLPIL